MAGILSSWRRGHTYYCTKNRLWQDKGNQEETSREVSSGGDEGEWGGEGGAVRGGEGSSTL